MPQCNILFLFEIFLTFLFYYKLRFYFKHSALLYLAVIYHK